MKSISRRGLLRAAGFGLGASLISPLIGRLTSAQTSSPRRFVFVVEGNGFEPVTVLSPLVRSQLDESNGSEIGDKRWWPRDYRHDSPLVLDSPDLAGARSLGPLEAHGVLNQTTVLLGLSSRIVGGSHSGRHGVLSSTRTVGGAPGGQTIDSYLGDRLGSDAPFGAVRLGVGTGTALDHGTCAAGRGQSLPLLLDPYTAYAMLFGSVSSGAAERAFMERADILEFARGDVESAHALFSGGAREGRKLERYRDAIQLLQNRQSRLRAIQDLIREFAPVAPGDLDAGFALDTLSAQFDSATAAIQSGLTNVAVIGSGTGGDFGLTYGSITNVDRHDMEHTSGRDPAMLNAVHTVTERQVGLIARMARTLADTPEREAEGNMLDHTLIVYIGDNGEQHHSTSTEFPVVLVGGQALGLQAGGRTIVYPGIGSSGHRQVSNLWNTMGYLAGHEVDDFGGEGPSRVQQGPLPELLT